MKLRSVRAGFLILISATIFITAAYAASLWRPCSGWRDCYLSWHLFWSGSDRLTAERRFALSQFAASSRWVAFSLPTQTSAVGLILFDRKNKKTRLIYEEGAGFFAPFLSSDNERLMFVRRSSSGREIISCFINEWICRSLLRTENPIRSPIEIDRDTIAYATSPLIVGYDKKERYNRYDILTKKRDETPVAVTNFGLYDLGPITVSDSRILFSALNGPYDIYSLQIDQLRVGGITPQQASKLALPDKAIIVDVSVSRDDQHMSFLQAETVTGQANFQYNLHVATTDAVTARTVKVEGIALSRGIFDQDSLIYNELFEGHYRISKLDLLTNTIEEIGVIPHSSSDIESLERIKLSIEQ